MELNSQKSLMPLCLRGPNYPLQTETADVACKRFHILSDETSDDSPLLGPVSLWPHQAPPRCGEGRPKVLTQLIFASKSRCNARLIFCVMQLSTGPS